jgi:hypothetical protein
MRSAKFLLKEVSCLQEHMNADQYKAALTALESKSKYHARKIKIDGILFDSQAEGDRYCQLKLLERAGKITDLDRQSIVQMSGGITWRMDFTYYESGTLILEDVKGCMTQLYKTKRKILKNDIKSGAICAIYRETLKGASTDYNGGAK